MSMSMSMSVSMSLSFCLCPFFVSVSCLCLWSLSLSVFINVSVNVSVFVSLSLSLVFGLSVSFFLCQCQCQRLCLSVSVSCLWSLCLCLCPFFVFVSCLWSLCLFLPSFILDVYNLLIPSPRFSPAFSENLLWLNFILVSFSLPYEKQKNWRGIPSFVSLSRRLYLLHVTQYIPLTFKASNKPAVSLSPKPLSDKLMATKFTLFCSISQTAEHPRDSSLLEDISCKLQK